MFLTEEGNSAKNLTFARQIDRPFIAMKEKNTLQYQIVVHVRLSILRENVALYCLI